MRKEKRKKKKFTLNFKSNFLTGLITILPLFITYIFFKWILKFLYKRLNFIPQKLFPGNLFLTVAFEIVLLLLIIFGVYLLGIVASRYIGKKLILASENILNKIPFIRTIYTGSKQIINAFMVNNKDKFMDVVLVEYPRKGIFVMGFITGKMKLRDKRKSSELIPVFIPSTPNPTTGFLVMFKKSDIIKLNLKIDEAIKFIISGGIIGNKSISKKV